MPRIRVQEFRGARTAVSPHNIGTSNALVSHNTQLRDTSLRPYNSAVLFATVPHEPLAMHLPSDMDNKRSTLLTHDHPVSYTDAPDPMPGSGWRHTILWHHNGQEPERFNAGTGEVSPLVIPAPQRSVIARPLATAIGIADTPDTRSYTYTWVDKFGVESVPAPPTNLGTVYDGQAFELSGFELAPARVVAIRLYRSASVLSDGSEARIKFNGSFQLVAELPAATTSYDDRALLKDIAFGTMLTTDNGTVPSGLEQVLLTEDGYYVGFAKNTIYVSERHEPWNWPYKYQTELPDRIVGIVGFNFTISGFGELRHRTMVFVATTGTPYRLTVAPATTNGVTEATVSPARFTEHWPCLSRFTLVATDFGAAYVTHVGIVLLTTTGEIHLVSKGRLDEDYWTDHMPNLAAWHNRRYYATRVPTGRGMVLEFTGAKQQPDIEGYATIDLPAQALHAAHDGRLYYADGADVRVWNEATEPLTYRWRSKVFDFLGRVKMGAASILADFGGPVRFTLYAGTSVVYSRLVSSTAPFRLPPTAGSLQWQFELSGSTRVHEVRIASDIHQLVAEEHGGKPP